MYLHIICLQEHFLFLWYMVTDMYSLNALPHTDYKYYLSQINIKFVTQILCNH